MQQNNLTRRNIAIILLLFLSEVIYLLFYSSFFNRIENYFWISIANSVIYAVIVLLTFKQHDNKFLLYALLAAGLIFRLSLLTSPPTASDDIYRYLWDGRVQANGINPYRYAPADTNLNYLHTEELPAKMNYKNMKSIYPPVAQYIFLLNYSLFGTSIIGFKFILFLFECLTIISLMVIMNSLKLPKHFAGYYALAPLPITQFMIDGHLDAIGIAMMITGLALFLREKGRIHKILLTSSVFLGLSVATKLVSGMIIPFLYDKKNWGKGLLLFILSITVFLLSYIPYFNDGVNPFEALATFTSHWVFNGSLFTVLLKITNNNQIARIICGMLFLALCVLLYFSKNGKTFKIHYVFFLFLLLSPTVHPWYVCWLAALLPIRLNFAALAYVLTANLANHVVIGYQLYGIWQQSDLILLMEYLPVYLLLVFELTMRKEKSLRPIT